MVALAGTPECLFVRVADWIRADAERKHEPASLAQLDVMQMARDLGVQEADLQWALPHRSDQPGLPTGKMVLRGQEAESVTPLAWEPMRHLVRNCTRCRATGRCRHARATGPEAHAGDVYCANTAAFNEPRQH